MPTPDRRQQHPRTDLLRTVSFTRSDDDDHGDGRTFTGYGAVFNSPTTIDSWRLFPGAVRPGCVSQDHP